MSYDKVLAGLKTQPLQNEIEDLTDEIHALREELRQLLGYLGVPVVIGPEILEHPPSNGNNGEAESPNITRARKWLSGESQGSAQKPEKD